MSLRVGKFTRSRTTPIAIVTLYLMLVRAQWQASRLRLPYVCPACRLVNSQRHYSQPREQARSSNQDDAAVLGASKRPKSVSKPGDVAAILNEVKRLSRPHATSQNVKTDTEDPVEQKSSKTSRQTEKSSAVDTKKRNRSASKSTTAEVLKTSVGSRRKRAEGSAQQSVKQTKKVVTKRRSVLDKLKDVFFDSHQEQVLAFSKNPNAGEQEGASSQWNLVNRVVQGASSDVTVDESGGNSSPGTSRRRRRRGVLIRQLPTRLRVRKIETREIPAPTAAKKCVTQQLAQRKRLRQAHELHGVPGKGLKQVLLESFGVQASSAQDTNQEHQSAPKKRKSKKKQTPASEANAVASEIESVAAAKIDVFPLSVATPPVPTLSYGLDRVLFNPGVYHLQDPRSRIYNFDPYLEKIMPAVEFDFSTLNRFVRPSEDPVLHEVAQERRIQYFSSTSGITNILKHFHYLVSQWRELTLSMLSKGFDESSTNFTTIQQAPTSAFLRYRQGRYAIDSDFTHDFESTLSLVGRSLEKLFTLPKATFEQYRKSNPENVPEELSSRPEAYHYTLFDKILIRSQLDAYDPRIPGTGMFDIKTRAVLPVRMDLASRGGLVTSYQIKHRHGTYESFEREYYDMIRAALLKYSMQVRLGRMDGIFVAFHNVERIFGFQYISLEDMDLALHGQTDRTLGDQELNASINILGAVLDRATERFPKQSLRLHFETRNRKVPFMYIFAEPVSEEKLQETQEKARRKRQKMQEILLNPNASTEADITEPPFPDGWSDLKEMVREEVSRDDSEQESEQESYSEQEVIEKLEERVVQLHSAIRLLRAKSDMVRRYLIKGDDLDDIPGVSSSSSDSEAQVRDIVKETGEIEKEFDVLRNARESHDTEDEDLRKRVEKMQSPLKSIGLELRRQITSNERMESVIQYQNGEIPKAPSFRKLQTMVEDGTENVPIEGSAESSEASVDDSASSEHQTAEPNDETTTEGERSPQPPPPDEEEDSDEECDDLDFPLEPPELLAFTLSIRNRVDGAYVKRPENFTAKQNWVIEYDLATIDDEEQAREQYKKSRRRQHTAQTNRDEARLEAWYDSAYMRKIYKISERGKVWREEMDRVDERVGVRVFGGAQGDGRFKEGAVKEEHEKELCREQRGRDGRGGKAQEVVKAVDDYLELLYKQR